MGATDQTVSFAPLVSNLDLDASLQVGVRALRGHGTWYPHARPREGRRSTRYKYQHPLPQSPSLLIQDDSKQINQLHQAFRYIRSLPNPTFASTPQTPKCSSRQLFSSPPAPSWLPLPLLSALSPTAPTPTPLAVSRLSVRTIEHLRFIERPATNTLSGYGPPSTTDNVFLANPNYDFIAKLAPTPQGYSAAFRDLRASTSQANYMGFYTLQTYNTTQCAEECNNANGCEAFNIFFERDPLLNPAPACPNPLPTTNIKCTLWGSPVSAATATNNGQYREQFHVVIAGSDGFNAN